MQSQEDLVERNLTLVAAVLFDVLLREVSSGRWQILSDGEIVPVDECTSHVIQFPQEPQPPNQEEVYASL